MRDPIRVGDRFTVAGVFQQVPNPDRAWWHFWKPRLVAGQREIFTIEQVFPLQIPRWSSDA